MTARLREARAVLERGLFPHFSLLDVVLDAQVPVPRRPLVHPFEKGSKTIRREGDSFFEIVSAGAVTGLLMKRKMNWVRNEPETLPTDDSQFQWEEKRHHPKFLKLPFSVPSSRKHIHLVLAPQRPGPADVLEHDGLGLGGLLDADLHEVPRWSGS